RVNGRSDFSIAGRVRKRLSKRLEMGSAIRSTVSRCRYRLGNRRSCCVLGTRRRTRRRGPLRPFHLETITSAHSSCQSCRCREGALQVSRVAGDPSGANLAGSSSRLGAPSPVVFQPEDVYLQIYLPYLRVDYFLRVAARYSLLRYGQFVEAKPCRN